MDFTPPAATVDLVARYRSFVDEELLPLESLVLSRPFGESLPTLNKVRERARARRLWGPQIPAQHGGLGLVACSLHRFVQLGGKLFLGILHSLDVI